MSWYGTHPTHSAEYIRQHCTPCACKLCVYWLRCNVNCRPYQLILWHATCPRCGLDRKSEMVRIEKELIEERGDEQ